MKPKILLPTLIPGPQLVFGASLALALWLALMSLALAQGPIYVDKDATGNNDGSSWADAYTDLQSALSVAAYGTEIWVAAGIYTPGVTISHTFPLRAGVQLYGGFAATETVRTQRDWETNLTILSGDIGGNDVTDANGVVTNTANITGANSYHVVYADGVTGDPITETTVLDGFTITAGQANSSFLTDSYGGGFHCAGNGSGNECSPSLSNMIFSGNAAYAGGAMYNGGNSSGASSPNLSNVTFFANTADFGGALLNDGENSGVSSPNLNNVTFLGNAAFAGGAMFNSGIRSGISSPSLSNVIFSGNAAFDSGGAMGNDASFSGTSSPNLSNVTFFGNSANYGGAMISSGRGGGASSPSLNNVILWGNTATISGTQLHSVFATPAFSYTLIQSGVNAISNEDASVIYGPNILTGDPLFINPAGADGITGTLDDDLRLSAGSPAIDAGDNDAVPGGLTTDLDGNLRFFDNPTIPDTGNGAPPIVDMGAYEWQGEIRYTLSVTVAGSGSVVLSPDQSDYALNATVTLTATPDTGWQFDGWSGDLSGAVNPASVLMDGNRTITATFSEIITPPTYTLSLISAGDGRGAIVADPDQPVYDYGTVVTLTATPDTGSYFAGWTGDVITVTNPITVLMTADTGLTATFELLTYTLNLTTVGSGTVTVEPEQASYTFGSAISLTATPDAGQFFNGWTGDANSADNPLILTMDSHKAITAAFASVPPTTYTLTVNTTGNGSVSPGTSTYISGTVVTLTATPDTGSVFLGWTGDVITVTNPISVLMSANIGLTATFSVEPLITYTLTVNTAGNGSVSPSSGTYISGTVLNLAATPGMGWQFDGWSGDLSGADNPASVLMDSHKAITATFSQISPNDTIYLPLILK